QKKNFLFFQRKICLPITTLLEQRKFLMCENMGGACKHQKTHGCSILPAQCKSRKKHCCRL
uniref:Uncharacterized protein n=1 Tax=Oryctolagus cuniculus TaxID=9986 RepID=A0A5F9C6H9_RABIT